MQQMLLDLGSAITDVLAFLGPADQHKLRRTSAALCEWFDSAAENGSLAFYVTFAPPSAAAAGPLRWKHATGDPRGVGPRQKANPAIPPATVTVHARNYCLSTFNEQAGSEANDGIIEEATIELVDNFSFEHKLVVAGLFGIRSIGDGFCRGVRAVEVEFKVEGSQLRSVGREWISNCPNLRSVTFVGFGALEEVGSWMCNCPSLESITFAGDMPKLKKVGSGWMANCTELKNVDLSGFTALEDVGDNWLYMCSHLESIAFSAGMPNLKKVGCYWMSKCPKLKQVDLVGFTALEEVGHDWLYGCSGLESVTFAGDMAKLKKVGSDCMSNCRSLKHVDLSGFTALEDVGDFWLSYCFSLESITFSADMPNLKRVGCCWMSSCTELKHVDLSGFTALEDVGDDWLRACSRLKIIFTGNMPKLKRVGKSWTPQSDRSLCDHLLRHSKLGLRYF